PAMAAWVLHPRYLRNMLAAGAMRIDLNGNAVAPVTADERSYALRALQWQHDRLYRQYSEARWNGRRMGAVLGMTRKDVFAELGRRLPKWPKEGDKVSMPVKIDET